MTDRRTVYQLRRLMTWLEAFKACFGHRAQKLAVRRYVQGLLSDSSRKSMEAMLARVTDPGSYQAFQYFITESVWEAEHVWRRLRALIPEREGLLILDGTSFPKQGKHSVGVARQYCGALGKIANCQVVVRQNSIGALPVDSETECATGYRHADGACRTASVDRTDVPRTPSRRA